MSREFFKPYKPKKRARLIVRTAGEIIQEYADDNLKLTLRQLYYQFVARGLLPNTEKSYTNLGNIISRARLGGLLDWSIIEDRVRQPVVWQQYASVADMMERALRSYRLPRLDGQDTYVELWVEKDALAGVLQPIAAKYHVTLMVNRGYSSSSAMKSAADRIRECCSTYGSKQAHVLYLGDLDPSGEDMVRDIDDRLNLFINSGVRIDFDGRKAIVEDEEDREERKPYLRIDVSKLALTMEQVDEYAPPPNPTKLSDSRAKAFVEKYGYESWEVDALPPPVLRSLIEDALEGLLDMGRMQSIIRRENTHRRQLEATISQMENTDS